MDAMDGWFSPFRCDYISQCASRQFPATYVNSAVLILACKVCLSKYACLIVLRAV